MRGTVVLLGWLLVLAMSTVGQTHAQSGRSKARQPLAPRRVENPPTVLDHEVKRSILALYDGAEEASEDLTRVHKLLELPLNHLGYRVAYWDIRKGLPTVSEAMRHRAVATWFGERIPSAHAYLTWARRVARARVRFIVMDFIGSALEPRDLAPVNAFLGHLGLHVRSVWLPPSDVLYVAQQDAAMIGFERRLDGQVPGSMLYRTAAPWATAHVTIGTRGDGPDQASQPVVTGPGGGFAGSGFTAHYDEIAERMSWVLDPFEFLVKALGPDDAPVPDTTTLVGRRMYFSHIDGDGWLSHAQVALPNRPEPLVSEVVVDALIKPYPDLPVSVGVIAADVDPEFGGTQRAARVARELYALPQVEVASHTYTHPYDWGAFATPDRDRELAQAASSSPPKPLRAYAQLPFDLDREVAGALDRTGGLAPPSRPPTLYLWSGDARPFAAAIRATRAHGVRNLNGGDSRLDDAYPSITSLSALARQVGGERQIYSGNANESVYTQGWTAPFDRFKLLGQTVRKTELPRRLKPFNVYYHMYSGERAESLAAVREHLDLARSSAVVPVTASHYAAIADGFFDVVLTEVGPGQWRVTNRGALDTLRLDHAQALAPDYARSSGLLGHTHHGGSLYVALDPAHAGPVLAIARPGGNQASMSSRPILVESRWPLSGLRPGPCGFEVDAQGFGPGQMTWNGLRPGPYAISAWRDQTALATTTATVDAAGRLAFALDVDAKAGVHLTVRCGS